MSPELDATLVGVTGEYLVAGELSHLGFIASITLRNTRGVDIIISSADGSRSASVQVKTNAAGQSSWILNKKAEAFSAQHHYYVFVSLKGVGVRPDFYDFGHTSALTPPVIGEKTADAILNVLR